MKKTFVLSIIALSVLLTSEAQTFFSPSISINYTTEGLYNMSYNRANWINILDVGIGQPLWRGGTLSMNLLSVNNLRNSDGKSGVADDLHIFSAIEDESVPLSLFMFGLEQQMGKVDLFLGVRNVNNDYFTSPWNSVFTSSVNGLYPCLSNNFPLSDSPYSALCFHAQWNITSHLGLKGSLYNGVASDKWSEVFRFRPSRDGIFFISELSYLSDDTNWTGNYHLGLAYGNTYDQARDAKSSNATYWALVEQPVARFDVSVLELLLQGGYSPDCTCETFWGTGLIWKGLFDREDYLGLLVNRAYHQDGDETALELTYAFTAGVTTFQPALHQVVTSRRSQTIGMLKVSLEF